MYDYSQNPAIIELNKLCLKILKPSSSETVQEHVKYADRMIRLHGSTESNDVLIENEIASKLTDSGRTLELHQFRELKHKLFEARHFKHNAELVHFLHCVANYDQRRLVKTLGWTGSMQQLGTGPMEITRSSGISTLHSSQNSRMMNSRSQDQVNHNQDSQRPPSRHRSLLLPGAVTTGGRNNSALTNKNSSKLRSGASSRNDSNSTITIDINVGDRGGKHMNLTEESDEVPKRNYKEIFSDYLNNVQPEIPESELIRELLYTLLGADGRFIQYSRTEDRFVVLREAGVTTGDRKLVERTAESGWLHRKIRAFVEANKWSETAGRMVAAFCAALQEHLTEFYRLVTTIESQLLQEEQHALWEGGQQQLPAKSDLSSMTLQRLSLWTMSPQVLLRHLAALCDVAEGKRGGALASEVASHLSSGDPVIRGAMHHLLTQLCRPLVSMVEAWIYDGELDDQHLEFFVASNHAVTIDALWHKKYSLRKSMIPNFIEHDQARKILITGKSINFLCQACNERTNIKNREIIQKTMIQNVSVPETLLQVVMEMLHYDCPIKNVTDAIFNQVLDQSFRTMVNTVYTETSRFLLDTLYEKYRFLEHLQAMRRYLLLGQGDFIQYLMDLLDKELAQPASELYLHNLTSVLETAIRGTNAQYEEPDILKRLDVRTLEVSRGDTGWDVFSLDYHVDGPLTTVFTPDSVAMYLRAFNFLWRAKRMEFILSNIWRQQMLLNRLYGGCMPELGTMFHSCQLLGSEMSHFVQQIEYYINFEVLECAWEVLMGQVNRAEDLDHLISAHQTFLRSIIRRCLLDEESKEMLSQLRAIFDIITNYQELQEEMFDNLSEEVGVRRLYDDKVVKATNKGRWGTSTAKDNTENERRKNFTHKSAPTFVTKFRVLGQTYKDMVNKFLGMLLEEQDLSLRFLCVRINYNNFYDIKTAVSISFGTASSDISISERYSYKGPTTSKAAERPTIPTSVVPESRSTTPFTIVPEVKSRMPPTSFTSKAESKSPTSVVPESISTKPPAIVPELKSDSSSTSSLSKTKSKSPTSVVKESISTKPSAIVPEAKSKMSSTSSVSKTKSKSTTSSEPQDTSSSSRPVQVASPPKILPKALREKMKTAEERPSPATTVTPSSPYQMSSNSAVSRKPADIASSRFPSLDTIPPPKEGEEGDIRDTEKVAAAPLLTPSPVVSPVSPTTMRIQDIMDRVRQVNNPTQTPQSPDDTPEPSQQLVGTLSKVQDIMARVKQINTEGYTAATADPPTAVSQHSSPAPPLSPLPPLSPPSPHTGASSVEVVTTGGSGTTTPGRPATPPAKVVEVQVPTTPGAAPSAPSPEIPHTSPTADRIKDIMARARQQYTTSTTPLLDTPLKPSSTTNQLPTTSKASTGSNLSNLTYTEQSSRSNSPEGSQSSGSSC